jgi:hypothetical protein
MGWSSSRPEEPKKPPIPNPGTSLDAGEETILWDYVKFATGIAPAVAGRRWYRDPSGRDIEPLLEQQAGWPHRDGPTGPPGEPSEDERDTVGVAVEPAGGISGNSASAPLRKYMDPRLEGDDFPVMVAEPRTFAVTAPWQLDPDRRPQEYDVFLTFTNRRFLLTGADRPKESSIRDFYFTLPRRVLWQVPRDMIARAEWRRYSQREGDVILYFTDGSWVRFQTGGGKMPRMLQEVLGEQ